MSSWGMESYLRGAPVMERIIKRHHPPMVLRDVPHLDIAIARDEAISDRKGYSLMESDFKILKENYIQHWGHIYVAGKRLFFPDGRNSLDFEIHIPGYYTLEAVSPARVDGIKHDPNDFIFLAEGIHSAVRLSADKTIALRWGKNLRIPSYPPPGGPIFFGKLI